MTKRPWIWRDLMLAEPFNIFMYGNLVPVFTQIQWDTEIRVILGEYTKRLPSFGDQAENPGSCQSGTLPAECQIMKQNNNAEPCLHLAMVRPLLSRFSGTPHLWRRWKSQQDSSSLATGRTWSGLKRYCITRSTSAPFSPHLEQAPSPFAVVSCW